jgi:hypothetical protein
MREYPGKFILEDRLAIKKNDDRAAHAHTLPKTSEDTK